MNISRKKFLGLVVGIGAIGFGSYRLMPSDGPTTLAIGDQFVPLKIDAMPKSGLTLAPDFWHDRANRCYQILFNFDATGKFLPIIYGLF